MLFRLKCLFLADRYQQLSDDLAQFDLFKDFLVADYHIFKSLIFAKITLAEDEYRLYRNLLILFIEKCLSQIYIFICIKIQNDFAKHKEKEEEVMNKNQGIIWTKSIAAI
jgi:deoxyadenosine/deoxycytidine kinase